VPFNVGDIVDNGGNKYVVVDVDRVGKYCVHRKCDGEAMYGWYTESLFTLVTPAISSSPVLTGMTQFFKDHKEKTNAA